MSKHTITLRDIYMARKRIAPIIRRTPLISSPSLTEYAGVPVYLKLDNLQETGTFKIRGAANMMLSMTPDEKTRGVITFSSGHIFIVSSWTSVDLGNLLIMCLSSHSTGVSGRNALMRIGSCLWRMPRRR